MGKDCIRRGRRFSENAANISVKTTLYSRCFVFRLLCFLSEMQKIEKHISELR